MTPGREQASRQVASTFVDSETAEVCSASTQEVSRSASESLATAAGWFAARTVTMLMIWLAVCALTMLAALADAACPAATANSAGSGWSPPSLSTVMVTS